MGNHVLENSSKLRKFSSSWLLGKTWLLLSNRRWVSPAVDLMEERGTRMGRRRMTKRQRRPKMVARRIERFNHNLPSLLLGKAAVGANVVKGSDAKRSYLCLLILLMMQT